jgi:hypothetical protein
LHTIALKPEDGTFFNLSASDLPGSFVCTVPSDPYALAAAFIHEFHHNTLFGIEESGPFFEADGEDEIEGENHYSPWVETLRPLHGILHAVYVFLPVFRFWAAAEEEGVSDEGRRAFARDQLARIPVQLRIGVSQLRRHAHFTPFGARLFEDLATEVAGAEEAARAMGAVLSAPTIGISPSGSLRPFRLDGRAVSVGESLLEHLSSVDVRDECREEKAALVRLLGS